MSFQHALWYFFIYAFLGWCTEVVFAAVNHGKFVNRGFLNGPVCPIYGFGVTAVLHALTPLSRNLAVLYVGSVLLTSALELCTGFLMDKLFHHKWWDYSKNPMNICGYVCLKFSLLWGFACVLVVDVLQPIVSGLVSRIPAGASAVLLCVLSGAILADTAATVATVVKLNRRLAQLDDVAAALHKLSDAIGQNVAGNAMQFDAASGKARAELSARKSELEKRREALICRVHSEQKRLLSAFPDLESRKHPEILARIKERLHKGA